MSENMVPGADMTNAGTNQNVSQSSTERFEIVGSSIHFGIPSLRTGVETGPDFKPNLKGLRFEKDGTVIIELEYISTKSKEPYAHTVILSGPDHSLWTVQVMRYIDVKSYTQSGDESASLPALRETSGEKAGN